MEEAQLQQIAQQLRKPDGEMGLKVGAMMNTGNRFINRYALEALHISPGDNILELGMGNGYFVKDILSANDSVLYTGCDYSETMIAEATAMNSKWITDGRADFHLGTADSLPFPDHNFNKVFGVNILYFWQDPATELAEIRRVLQPGGLLVLGIKPKEAMLLMPFTKYGFTMYSREELAALLSANGFSVTRLIEKDEPPQEINGEMIQPAILIACAVRT
jgi:ubiquinone/menaquinone biosynthesis C-methylase UbiE